MGKPTEKAWKMLEDGKDIEEIRLSTGLSKAVIEAMHKDFEREQYRRSHRG